ncbi:hypothetical protein SAMN04487911_1506 [Arenibacter nanhaiticus]|uniref:Uncharacterized protein n=1 Tax=Arenibacter nanhaiticus TaxID=558155 RepID=A0A1M6MXU5_9FLAO|nr:hypothetical protein SAMN04487911_1506 [Arenibacter nanhaiticus]
MSILLKFFNFLVFMFFMSSYFVYLFFAIIQIWELKMNNNILSSFMIALYGLIIVYLISLFAFQKLYYKNSILRSIVFASIINFFISLVLFILSSIISDNDFVNSIISFEKIESIILSYDSIREMYCALEFLTIEELNKYKKPILNLFTYCFGILMIFFFKTILIVYKYKDRLYFF